MASFGQFEADFQLAVNGYNTECGEPGEIFAKRRSERPLPIGTTTEASNRKSARTKDVRRQRPPRADLDTPETAATGLADQAEIKTHGPKHREERDPGECGRLSGETGEQPNADHRFNVESGELYFGREHRKHADGTTVRSDDLQCYSCNQKQTAEHSYDALRVERHW